LVIVMLEKLFGSKSSERVLTFLALYREGYASQIAKESGISLFAAQKQLSKFEKAGILVSHTAGRKRIYIYNPHYPLLGPLRLLIRRALPQGRGSVRGKAPSHLPQSLREYFWDYPFDQLSWERDRDLVIRRLLMTGSWETLRWLRRQVGDAALRNWLIVRRGRGLTARQLRFWGLILNLPRKEVNVWVKAARSGTWSRR
jgi:hypothetical protein